MVEEKLIVEMYTDGACSGNPGPGGYGTILRYKDKLGVYHEKEFKLEHLMKKHKSFFNGIKYVFSKKSKNVEPKKRL